MKPGKAKRSQRRTRRRRRRILYHYTNTRGCKGILTTCLLFASTAATSPKDVRYGDGQYLSDIKPGSKRATQLARIFLNLPFQRRLFTHFVAIDVTDLTVVEGRQHVFVIPNKQALDLVGRIVRSGVLKG